MTALWDNPVLLDRDRLKARMRSRAARSCRMCGCTERAACVWTEEGLGQVLICSWAAADLCNAPACMKAAAAEVFAEADRVPA